MEGDDDYDSDSTVMLDDFVHKPHIIAAKRRKLAAKHGTAIKITNDTPSDYKNTAPDDENDNINIQTDGMDSSLLSKNNKLLKHKQWQINKYFSSMNDIQNCHEDNVHKNDDPKIKSELLKQESDGTGDVKEGHDFNNFVENEAKKQDGVDDGIITIDDSDDDCVISEILDNSGSKSHALNNKITNSKASSPSNPRRSLINSRRVTINDFKTNETITNISGSVRSVNAYKNEPRLIVLKPAAINSRRSTIDYSETNHGLPINIGTYKLNEHYTENLPEHQRLSARAPGFNILTNNTDSVTSEANVVTGDCRSNDEKCSENTASKSNNDIPKVDTNTDSGAIDPGSREKISELKVASSHEDCNADDDQRKLSKVNAKSGDDDKENQFNSDETPSVNANHTGVNVVENDFNISTEVTVELAYKSDSSDFKNKNKNDKVVNIYVNTNEISRKRLSIDISSPDIIKRIRTCNDSKFKNDYYQNNNAQDVKNTETNHAKGCANTSEEKGSTYWETNDPIYDGQVVYERNTSKTSDVFETNDPIVHSTNVENSEESSSNNEEFERVIKFQVGFCTLIKENLEEFCQMYSVDSEKAKAYRKSADSLTNEIEHLKALAYDGRVKADIQYACPECTRVSTYSLFSNNNINGHNFKTPASKCKICRGIGSLYDKYMKKFLRIQNKKKHDVKKDNRNENNDSAMQQEHIQTTHKPSYTNDVAIDKGKNNLFEPVQRQLRKESEELCGESINNASVAAGTSKGVADKNTFEFNNNSNREADCASIHTGNLQVTVEESASAGPNINAGALQSNVTCNQESSCVLTEVNISNDRTEFSSSTERRNELTMSKNNSEPCESSLTSCVGTVWHGDGSDFIKMFPESNNNKESSGIEGTSTDKANNISALIVERDLGDILSVPKIKSTVISNGKLNNTVDIDANNTSVNTTAHSRASKSITVLKTISGPATDELQSTRTSILNMPSTSLSDNDSMSTVLRATEESSNISTVNPCKLNNNSIKNSCNDVKSNKRQLKLKRIRTNLTAINEKDKEAYSSHKRVKEDSYVQNISTYPESGDKCNEINLTKKSHKKHNTLDKGIIEGTIDYYKNKMHTKDKNINATSGKKIIPNTIDTRENLEANRVNEIKELRTKNHEKGNSESSEKNEARKANEELNLIADNSNPRNSEIIDVQYAEEQNPNDTSGKKSDRDDLKYNGVNKEQTLKHNEREPNNFRFNELIKVNKINEVNTNQRNNERETNGEASLVHGETEYNVGTEEQTINNVSDKISNHDTHQDIHALEARGVAQKQGSKINNHKQQCSGSSKQNKTNEPNNERNTSEYRTDQDTNEKSSHDVSEMSDKEFDGVPDTADTHVVENENNVNDKNDTIGDESNTIGVRALEDCFNKIKNNLNVSVSIPSIPKMTNSLNLSNTSKAFVNKVVFQDKNDVKPQIEYMCNICTCMFRSGARLMHHMRDNHNNNSTVIPIQCVKRECSFCHAYLTEKAFNLHVKKCHPNEFSKEVKNETKELKAVKEVFAKFKKADCANNNEQFNASETVGKFKYKCLKCHVILNSEYSVRKHRKDKHPDMINKKLVDKVFIEEKGQQSTGKIGKLLSEKEQHTSDEDSSDQRNSNSDTDDSEGDIEYESDQSSADGSTKDDVDEDSDKEQDAINHDDGNSQNDDDYSGDDTDTECDEDSRPEANLDEKSYDRRKLQHKFIGRIRNRTEFETSQTNRKYTCQYKCSICEVILKSAYAVRKHRKEKHPNMKYKKVVDKISITEKGQQNTEKSVALLSGKEVKTSNKNERDQQTLSNDMNKINNDIRYGANEPSNAERHDMIESSQGSVDVSCQEDDTDESDKEQEASNLHEGSTNSAYEEENDPDKVIETSTASRYEDDDDIDAECDKDSGPETNLDEKNYDRRKPQANQFIARIKNSREFDTSQTNRKYTCQYKCTLCDVIFKSGYAVRKHRNDEHPSMKNEKLFEISKEIVIKERQQNTEKSVKQSSEGEKQPKRSDKNDSDQQKTINGMDTEQYHGLFGGEEENKTSDKKYTDQQCRTSSKYEVQKCDTIQYNENVNRHGIVGDSQNKQETSSPDESSMAPCHDNGNSQNKRIEQLQSGNNQKDDVKDKRNATSDAISYDKTDINDQRHLNNKCDRNVDQDYGTTEVNKIQNVSDKKRAMFSNVYKCCLCKEYFHNSYAMRQHREINHPLMNNVKIFEKVTINNEIEKEQRKKVDFLVKKVVEDVNDTPRRKSCSLQDVINEIRTVEEITNASDKKTEKKNETNSRNNKNNYVIAGENKRNSKSVCCEIQNYDNSEKRAEYGTEKEPRKVHSNSGNQETTNLGLIEQNKYLLNYNIENRVNIHTDNVNDNDNRVTSNEDKDRIVLHNSKSSQNTTLSNKTCENDKLGKVSRGNQESRKKDQSNEANIYKIGNRKEDKTSEMNDDKKHTANYLSGADSNARVNHQPETSKHHGKCENRDGNSVGIEVHKNARLTRYFNCYTCGVNFDVNVQDHTCFSFKETVIFYNCYACGVNLNSNMNHACPANVHEYISNIQITNVVSMKETYVFSCNECNYTTDSYDSVVRHCQNHYNEIENPVTHCGICQLDFDETRFDAHRILHERNVQVVNYSYAFVFSNLDTILDGLPADVAREMKARSIYATHRVRMEIIEDGPWEYSLYQCDQCRTCVPPRDIVQHCHSKCSDMNYVCAVCDRSFISLEVCINHEVTHRVGAKVFRVIAFNKLKDEPFNFKLMESLKTQESDTKVNASQIADIYRCQCSLCFVSNENFKIHFLECKSDTPEGILCPECPVARLFLPSELKKHQDLHHTEVKCEFIIQQINISRSIEPNDFKCEVEVGVVTTEHKSVFADTESKLHDSEMDIKRELLKQESETIFISDDED